MVAIALTRIGNESLQFFARARARSGPQVRVQREGAEPFLIENPTGVAGLEAVGIVFVARGALRDMLHLGRAPADPV